MARAVEVHADVDVGFLRRAAHLGRAFAGEEQLGNTVPRHAVAPQDERLAADVAGKQGIRLTVADDVGVGNVVLWVVHVLLHHRRAGLARRRIVLGKVAVNELLVERDAFALQRLEDKVMDGPERVLGERVSAQSVLVAHHDEAEVQLLADKRQVTEHALSELEFLERVDLLVGRLLYESTVAVNEEYALLFHYCK